MTVTTDAALGLHSHMDVAARALRLHKSLGGTACTEISEVPTAWGSYLVGPSPQFRAHDPRCYLVLLEHSTTIPGIIVIAADSAALTALLPNIGFGHGLCRRYIYCSRLRTRDAPGNTGRSHKIQNPSSSFVTSYVSMRHFRACDGHIIILQHRTLLYEHYSLQIEL